MAGPSELPESLIRAQLERILASETFSRSERMSAFLRFVVERTLEGVKLKEQVLASELYGRGAGFDTAADAVVRVDARRLRDKLREYYAEFPQEPVIVSLPKGGYVPAFERNAAVEAAPAQEPVKPVRRVARTLVWGIASTAAVLVTAAWLALPKTPDLPPKIIPLTSYPGDEAQPALSPDGNFVAFRCEPPDQPDQRDICVKAVGVEALQRITVTPEDEHWPAWSPDGKEIAFGRGSQGRQIGIFIASRLGGPERKVSDTGVIAGWTPDGKSVLIRDRVKDEPYGIFQVDLDTLKRRRLTQPSLGDGDWRFEVSPDGATLATIRFTGPGAGDLFLSPMQGGEPRRLTEWNGNLSGVAWMPDGKELVYSLEGRLWRIPADLARPGRGTPIAGIPMQAIGLSISRPGRGHAARLAFKSASHQIGLRRVDLASAGDGETFDRIQRFVPATRVSTPGRFSPDGSRVAFVSNRASAGPELWVAASDGAEPRQLTSFEGSGGMFAGSWSPDGTRILFEMALEGNSDIYVVAAGGGKPLRLTTAPSLERTAEWSRDGKWIYYASLTEGAVSNIWRMPAEGGVAVQITTQGGFEPQESPDGRYLYYVDRVPSGRIGTQAEAHLLRMPTAGGGVETVYDAVTPFRWSVTEKGIYFLRNDGPSCSIYLLPSGGGRARRAGKLPFHIPSALTPGRFTVARDGRWALVNVEEQHEGDIMLLDHFR
jgi:Tol biopolymer transport system component